MEVEDSKPVQLAKEEKREEEEDSKSAKFKPGHASLVAWDEARRARELNGIK